MRNFFALSKSVEIKIAYDVTSDRIDVMNPFSTIQAQNQTVIFKPVPNVIEQKRFIVFGSSFRVFSE